MAGILPSVRGGSSALLPLERTITFDTDPVRFEDSSEQRFLNRGSLDTFVLNYKAISQADRVTLDQFVATQVGSFDTTWTFPFKPAVRAKNGNFALGLKDWLPAYDPGFQPFISQGRGYGRADGSVAVYINTAVTIAAGATITASFIGSQFAYPVGQTLTLDLWATLATNGSFPSGITPRMSFGLRATNGGTFFGSPMLSTTLTGSSGWRQVNGNLTNTFTGSNTGSVLVVCTLTNTSSASVSIPFNSSAFVISEVRVFDPNPETGVYPACTFEDDSFSWTLNREWPNCVDGSIKCRQVKVGGQGATGSIGAFPGFGPTGVSVSGYPYVATDNYSVAKSDFSTGPKTSFAFTGQSGFPSRALRTWTLTLSTLNDSELARLESHFLAAVGSWNKFSFTDPVTSKVYGSVRYDMDALTISHIYKGLSSATVKLVEVFSASWTA